VVIDAHLHRWNTERLHYLSPAGRDAVRGGTATRFYALGS